MAASPAERVLSHAAPEDEGRPTYLRVVGTDEGTDEAPLDYRTRKIQQFEANLIESHFLAPHLPAAEEVIPRLDELRQENDQILLELDPTGAEWAEIVLPAHDRADHVVALMAGQL
jgi:hypothetical protein